MMDLAITDLVRDDLAAVAEIHAACFDDAWDEAVLGRILNMPGAFGLVAHRPPEPSLLGFALARVSTDECELLSLGVLPRARGSGAGSALFDTTMARAVAANARILFLEVAEDNGPARRLYAARGMVQVGRRPRYYELRDGRYMDALTLRRDLYAELRDLPRARA